MIAYLPNPTFPTNVWNGVSGSRPALHEIQSPDDTEIKRIIAELIAIQQYLYDGAFTFIHNDTTDWGTESGGLYTITIAASVHKVHNPRIVQAWELNGTDYDLIRGGVTPTIDTTSIANNDDVSISVTSAPDRRYAGRIIVA